MMCFRARMKFQVSRIWGTCPGTAVQMPFLYIQIMPIKIITSIFENVHWVLTRAQALWELPRTHESIIEFLSS